MSFRTVRRTGSVASRTAGQDPAAAVERRLRLHDEALDRREDHARLGCWRRAIGASAIPFFAVAATARSNYSIILCRSDGMLLDGARQPLLCRGRPAMANGPAAWQAAEGRHRKTLASRRLRPIDELVAPNPDLSTSWPSGQNS